MASLDERRQQAISAFVRRLRAALGHRLVDVRLFGSVARGEAEPDSDIDILVVVQPQDWSDQLEWQIVDLAFDENLQYNLYISPIVLTSERLEHPVWGQTPFMKNVRRESVPL